MLRTLRDKGLLWPGLATLVGIALLVALGNWQMQRLAWKEGLIAAIEARVHQPPVPLKDIADVANDKEYWHVAVTGRFRHADERRLFATNGDDVGWHVYTPLDTDFGKIVWVNRGFVPEALKDPAARKEGQVEGPVTVRGLLRMPPDKGWFDPDADVARNQWYWRDLKGMTATLGAEDRDRVLPFFVDAEAEPANPGGWPRGGVTRLELPNRHLEYALTWYGLAVALAGVFAAFAISRWRGRPST